MAATGDFVVKITVDTEEAEARLRHLSELAEGVPQFEYEDLEEVTFSWPWWHLVLAGATGGLIVLLAFFLIGSVFA